MDYRLGSTDWIPALGNVAGLERIAVIGAGAVANAGAVAKLREIVPGARVDGMPGEGWNEDVEETAVEWLNRLRPQLVLLGLGMPLQEQVLARRLAALPPAVYCAVGGAIEQIAGVQKLAPRWIGRLGLEWAWRLMLHPQRVAYRVFGEPWVLLGLLLRRRLRRQPWLPAGLPAGERVRTSGPPAGRSPCRGARRKTRGTSQPARGSRRCAGSSRGSRPRPR